VTPDSKEPEWVEREERIHRERLQIEDELAIWRKEIEDHATHAAELAAEMRRLKDLLPQPRAATKFERLVLVLSVVAFGFASFAFGLMVGRVIVERALQ